MLNPDHKGYNLFCGILTLIILAFSFAQDPILGDLNEDELVDILDVKRTINILLDYGPDPTEYENWAGDVNEDTLINVVDIIFLTQLILGKEPRIMFIQGGLGFSEICTMKQDGSDITVIASSNYIDEIIPQNYKEARWSPDKNYIAILGGPRESLHYYPLWIMDNEGNLLNEITWDGEKVRWLDNQNIIYQKVDYNGKRIYKNNILGSNEELVYETPESTYFTVTDLIPFTNLIVGTEDSSYVIDGVTHHTDTEIVTINLGTGEKVSITDNEIYEYGPKISLNNQLISYIKSTPNEVPPTYNYYNLYLLDLETSNVEQLTFDEFIWVGSAYSSTVWSPYQTKIAYSTPIQSDGVNNTTDIFTINLITYQIDTLTTSGFESGRSLKVMDWR